MVIQHGLEDEVKFSSLYKYYKYEDNGTVWQGSSLLGLTRNGEVNLKLVIYGVVMIPMTIFGMIGNLLSIVVFTRPGMRSPINRLLCGQAFTDLVLCCVSIPFLCVPNVWNFLRLMEVCDGYFSSATVSSHMPTLQSIMQTCNSIL